MANKMDEIVAIIKEQIRNYNKNVDLEEEGKVISVGDGIATIYGLKNAMLGELLVFSSGIYGIVATLEESSVSAMLMGDESKVCEEDIAKRTRKVVEVPVGDALLGRVINALGIEIDGGPKIKASKFAPIEKVAPGVMTRQSVNQPLETGILAIDAMVPIGKGQRELIIGDRQTGKTSIAIDTIINQKDKNVYCIYVAIGQKNSTIAQIVNQLKEHGAMEYSVVLSSSASESAPLQYIIPYTGVTIAEEWMSQGKDVLIVYDDLSKHAVAYRSLSLLLRKPPGREAYPGDVFYLHSRLLERAAKLNSKYGGGSITALPIIETQAGDISAYIPTNVISITDGQIFLISDYFNSGIRPAISSGISVSRVGSIAQIKAMKKAAASLKLELAQYYELQSFAQFGSDLDPTTKEILDHGSKVIEVLKQNKLSPISQIIQVILLLAVKHRFLKWIPVNLMKEYKEFLMKKFDGSEPYKKLSKAKDITLEIEPKLLNFLKTTTKEFIKKQEFYSFPANLNPDELGFSQEDIEKINIYHDKNKSLEGQKRS